MKLKKRYRNPAFFSGAVVLAAALMYCPAAFGQMNSGSSGNSGRWAGMNEFQVVVNYLTPSDVVVRDIPIPGMGTNDGVLSMEDSFLYGLGGGVNLNEHLNFNGQISYGSVKYDASWGDQVLTGKGSMFNGNIGLDYNFIDGPFTPFINAGIGFSYFDTGVPDGPPDIGCWWDPWWGYICTGSQQTYDQWSFTWQGGAGLRMDLGNGMLIKAAYTVFWADLGAAGTTAFPGINVTAGWAW